MPQRLVGFVDPTLQPADAREARILQDVVRLGLCLHRVHPGGSTLRIAGHGFFEMTDGRDLAAIDALTRAVGNALTDAGLRPTVHDRHVSDETSECP